MDNRQICTNIERNRKEVLTSEDLAALVEIKMSTPRNYHKRGTRIFTAKRTAIHKLFPVIFRQTFVVNHFAEP